MPETVVDPFLTDHLCGHCGARCYNLGLEDLRYFSDAFKRWLKCSECGRLGSIVIQKNGV
jgi:transposase